jgi:hypothetical protein
MFFWVRAPGDSADSQRGCIESARINADCRRFQSSIAIYLSLDNHVDFRSCQRNTCPTAVAYDTKEPLPLLMAAE